MKHHFSPLGYTEAQYFRTRRGIRTSLDFLDICLAIALAIGYFYAREGIWQMILWGFATLTTAFLVLNYHNRLHCKVYIENRTLYRKGCFFGFRLQITKEHIKEIVYKRTLIGDCILVLTNDCAEKPRPWSEAIVVIRDTPENRENLKYLDEVPTNDLLI